MLSEFTSKSILYTKAKNGSIIMKRDYFLSIIAVYCIKF